MSNAPAQARSTASQHGQYAGPAQSIRPRPIPVDERMPVVHLYHRQRNSEIACTETRKVSGAGLGGSQAPCHVNACAPWQQGSGARAGAPYLGGWPQRNFSISTLGLLCLAG